MTLRTYNDFIERVNELGFIGLSHGIPGLPSLSTEAEPGAWHTGDRETDPWQWKDRAAEEKKAAYGSILGGHKGLVAPRLYAVFYAAFHPVVSMVERWEAGEVDQTLWRLWQLFEKRTLLDTSDVRREMGVSSKNGASRVDAALVTLQRQFYLTVAGVRKKTAKSGQLYGWPASVFDRVMGWTPAEWLEPADGIDPMGARELIIDTGVAIGHNIDPKALADALGFGDKRI